MASKIFIMILIFCWVLPVAAKSNVQTLRYIQMARDALAVGLYDKWEEALKNAGQAFGREKSRMSLSEQNNIELWLSLLWHKYHTFRGTMPKIMDPEEFENRDHIQGYIQQFQHSISHLRQALSALKQYNVLYYQVANRSKIEHQLHFQESSSRERDLENTINQAQIYNAFLKFLLQYWIDKKTIKTRLKRESATIRTVVNNLGKMQRGHQESKQQQVRLAHVVQQVDEHYIQNEVRLKSQANRAKILFWTGLVSIILGAGGGVAGGYLIYESDMNKISMDHKRMLLNAGIGSIVAGSGVFAIGFTLMLIGITSNPNVRTHDKAVIEAQNKYLESERQQPPSTAYPPTSFNRCKVNRSATSNCFTIAVH
jgi:predicted transcriptional regulator